MAKLTLLAAVAATALASTATATTSSTPNPKTCNAAFLNALASTSASYSLSQASSPFGGCFANATAGLTGKAGFSQSAANLLTGFLNVDAFSAAQTLVDSSPLVLQASVNQVWWSAGAVAAGVAYATLTSNPTPSPIPCPTNASLSAQAALQVPANGVATPCPTGWPAVLWAGIAPDSTSPAAAGLNTTYQALVQAFAYNAILPTFPLLPPCLPAACQYAVTQTCQGNATVYNTAPLLQIMYSVFGDINTYAVATKALFSGTSGALLASSITAANPTFVTNPPATLNCTQFGGWGASLSAANGGTKGDATSSARVGVLAAAVAVMAAAIAA